MEKQNLYFIAIVLPEALCSMIIEIQTAIADRYQSRKSLKVIPHITLKAPFTFPASDHDLVLRWFSQLDIRISPFQIALKDFDAFPNPKGPVIYIPPVKDIQLPALQKTIIQQFYRTFNTVPVPAAELSFRPHVTVAYRDLTPEMFREAWLEFAERRFSASFTATQFQLLQHNTKQWNVIGKFDLK